MPLKKLRADQGGPHQNFPAARARKFPEPKSPRIEITLFALASLKCSKRYNSNEKSITNAKFNEGSKKRVGHLPAAWNDSHDNFCR